MEAKQRKLKIVYVGNFAPTSVGEPEIAWALEQLGHKVVRLDENKTTLGEVQKNLHKTDFLFYAKFRVGTKEEQFDFIRSCPVPTVCWLFDLYWGYRREDEVKMDMSPWAKSTIVFTTDGGHDAMWKRYNINHFLLRQGIDERIKMSKEKFDTKAEIGFIGSRMTWAGWRYRADMLDWLKDVYGDRFEHFGEGGDIRHERLDNLLNTLKITICDTVQSPNYWSNRIYETVGRGGFAIHPRTSGLSDEFVEYKHFIPYNYGNFADLKQKIDFYLENNEEREKIRKAGFEYCHQKHTYRQRCEQLIGVLAQEKII